MAKGVYIGVHREAENNNYINATVLTPSNIANYASVSNRTQYFVHGSDGTFTSNNAGQNGTTAQTIINFSTLEEKYPKDTKFTLKYEWTVSSESSYDIFTINYRYSSVDKDIPLVAGASGTNSGSGTITIYPGTYFWIKYTKDSSGASGNDKATVKFTLSGGTPNKAGGDYARRVIGMYIGVNGVARRVKRAYIGVNGIARCFWSAPGLYKVTSTVTPLSPARYELNAGSIGNYAVYANGGVGLTVNDLPTYMETSTCEYYNNSLTKSTASATIQQSREAGVASNNRYLFIAGGYGNYVQMVNGSPDYTETYFNTVTRYNTSMTRSTGTTLPYSGYQICSVSLPNYAIFAGGKLNSGFTTAMCYYNTSGTRSTGTALSAPKANVAGAAAGSCPIFAGGLTTSGQVTAQVAAYNSSLTRITMADLTIPRENVSPCSVGNYAIFYGGEFGNGAVATVEAYNSSLTKVSVPQAKRAVYGCMFVTTSDKKYALFAGGMGTGLADYQSSIEAYDTSLTKTLGPSLNSFRWNGIVSPTVCSIMNKAGNYIVVAGGEYYDANNTFGAKCTTSEAYQYVS